jgi:hypothetical protein
MCVTVKLTGFCIALALLLIVCSLKVITRDDPLAWLGGNGHFERRWGW